MLIRMYEKLIRLIENDTTTTSKEKTFVEVDNNKDIDVDAMIDCMEYYGRDADESSRNTQKKMKKLILDVRTRWNSSFFMIQRFVSQKDIVKQYMHWYNLPSAQKNHFGSTRTKLEDITEREWAIVLGLCYLFEPVAVATEELSAEKRSTIASVAPTINFLGNIMHREDIFDKPSTEKPRQGQCKWKHILYRDHEGKDYFNDVIKLLNECREDICKWFDNKFNDLIAHRDGRRGKYAWTTLLNPKEYHYWTSCEGWEDEDAIIEGLKDDFKAEVKRIAIANYKKKAKKAEKIKIINDTLATFEEMLETETPSTPRKNDLGGRLYNMYSPPKETEEEKKRKAKSADVRAKRDPLDAVLSMGLG
jgi:hypothetical protein